MDSRNRRYLNINVHSDEDFYNLGLARVNGSLPAEECVKLVGEKLSEYNLVIDNDIVCVTTDGARVMTKVGKLIDAEQQLCYAHAIHLAVTDVLYKKSPSSKNLESEEKNYENEEDSDQDDSDGEGLKIINRDDKKSYHRTR